MNRTDKKLFNQTQQKNTTIYISTLSYLCINQLQNYAEQHVTYPQLRRNRHRQLINFHCTNMYYIYCSK